MNERFWVWVTAVENIPPREGRAIVVAGRELAFFNLGDRVVATDNRCPHRGGPLADGIVSGGAVVCPLHGWKINLQDGAVERPCETAGRVETYPVRIDNGLVVIGLPADFGGRIDEATEHAATVCGLQEVNSCG
jgi:nitrite reductase (NADH) small subunit